MGSVKAQSFLHEVYLASKLGALFLFSVPSGFFVESCDFFECQLVFSSHEFLVSIHDLNNVQSPIFFVCFHQHCDCSATNGEIPRKRKRGKDCRPASSKPMKPC